MQTRMHTRAWALPATRASPVSRATRALRAFRPLAMWTPKPSLNPPPQKKLYTIHLQEKKKPFVFHIQEEDDAPTSAYLVCFEEKEMCQQMIKLIQTHYALYGDWPSTTISPENPLDLTLPDDAPGITEATLQSVPRIWAQHWRELDLDVYAKQTMLNLFHIRGDMSVQMYHFEYNLESLQSRFEKHFDIDA